MTNKNKDNRPTSPHLQIYAWNLSSFTSIMHRATGIALYFAIVAISWYVILFTYDASSNSGEMAEKCNCLMMQALQYISIGAIIFIIFGLCYHFCNGIRHLFWDIGKGFELKEAKRSAILVISLAFLFTIAIIGFIAYFKFL